MAVSFFDQFDIQTGKPIDVRMIVDTKSDLTSPTSFTSGLYTYKGMMVVVLNDESEGNTPQTYLLTVGKADADDRPHEIVGNWRRFSQGGNISDSDDVEITNAQAGDILIFNGKDDDNEDKWYNIGPALKEVSFENSTATITFTKTDNTTQDIVLDLSSDSLFATESKTGVVVLSTSTDISTSNDTIEIDGFEAPIVTKPSDVKTYVDSALKYVTPPPTLPNDIVGYELGNWSADQFYMYICMYDTDGTTLVWKRTTLEKW